MSNTFVEMVEVIDLTLDSAGPGILQLELSLRLVIIIKLEDEVIQSPVVGAVQDIIRVSLKHD